MDKQKSNLFGLATAVDTPQATLSDKERDCLHKLVRVYNNAISNNDKRWDYYKDRHRAKSLGIAVPDSLADKMNLSIGWANKAVSMLAQRSLFDGFSIEGYQDERITDIVDKNDFELTYEEAVPSELVFGCGFFTVTKDNDNKPIVRYYDARNASAVWDYDNRRIKYGFVINDYKLKNAGYEEPSQVLLHTSERVVILEYIEGKWYVAGAKTHILGEPLMVAMAYNPSTDLPFGRSRISKTVMAITDSMQREIMNTQVSSELYSRPKEFWIGVSEDQFDNKSEADYFKPLIAMERDEEGDKPEILQLKQSSMTPHIDIQRNLASRMAGETSVPVNSLGIIHDNPASAEALKASLEDLCVLAEKMNRVNGRALEKVMRIALAVLENKQLADVERVEVSFKNPFTPSIAARTDAMTKQASMTPFITQTELYWKNMGYSSAERANLLKEQKKFLAQQGLNQLLLSMGVDNGTNEQSGVATAFESEGDTGNNSQPSNESVSGADKLRNNIVSQKPSNRDNK